MHYHTNVDETDPEIIHGDSEVVHHFSINGLVLKINQIHLFANL